MPGIGKSTVAREVCHFIFIRNFYKDGAIYLNCNKCFTIVGLINLMVETVKIQNSLNVNLNEKFGLFKDMIKGRDLVLYFDKINMIV